MQAEGDGLLVLFQGRKSSSLCSIEVGEDGQDKVRCET
jgi:hypothetical protein